MCFYPVISFSQTNITSTSTPPAQTQGSSPVDDKAVGVAGSTTTVEQETTTSKRWEVNGAINETRRILLEDVYFDAPRYGGYGGVDDLTDQFGRWGI
jgi:hypothetical protein